MLGGLRYEAITDQGLKVSFEGDSDTEVIEADNVILCAGQLPNRSLYDELLQQAGNDTHIHLIGGADEAAELDAKRAINQGARLAATL